MTDGTLKWNGLKKLSVKYLTKVKLSGTTQLEISVGNKSQLEIFDFQPHGSVRNICDSVGNICDSVRNICDSVGNICDSVRNN